MSLRHSTIIILKDRQVIFLILLVVVLISIEAVMFVFEILEVSLITFNFVLFNLLFEVHLRLIEWFELQLLLFVRLKCHFVLLSFFLGIVEGKHVPHGELRLFLWAADGLSLDGLINFIFALGWCSRPCVIKSGICQIILKLPFSRWCQLFSMQRLPHFPQNIILKFLYARGQIVAVRH